MEPTITNRSFELLGLPVEVQTLIFREHCNQEDILSLRETCKQLSRICLGILFVDLQVKLSTSYQSLRTIESLMLNGPEAFSLTRSLTVEGVVVSGPDGSTYEECDAIGPYGEICFWDTDQNSAETLNWIVRMILKKFSKGQLRKFEWLHDAPLLTETLLFLESTQVESLRELIVTHYYDDGEGLGNDPNNFNKLESLEFREDDLAISFIAYLYRENIQSLRHFAIGRNHSIARLYTDDGRPDSNDADSQYDAMREFLDYDTRVDFGKSVLESLAICGFDVQPSLNEKHTGLFNYEKLTSLRLESCVGSNELLRSLASQNKSASQFPKDSFLKEFTFRYEKPTGHTRSALSDFLKSFSGLRKLFVLLDETTIMPSLDCFTQTHGRTLTALLWDGRVGPRPGWTGSNTANMSFLPGAEFKNAFHFVTSKCPNLVELGFPFDWEYGVSVTDCIHRLLRLKYLNIRNWPPKHMLPKGLLSPRKNSEYFVNQVLFNIHHPALAMVAIGSINFNSERRDWSGEELQRTRDYFLVKQLQRRFARTSYGIRHAPFESFGPGCKTINQSAEIFKPFWIY